MGIGSTLIRCTVMVLLVFGWVNLFLWQPAIALWLGALGLSLMAYNLADWLVHLVHRGRHAA